MGISLHYVSHTISICSLVHITVPGPGIVIWSCIHRRHCCHCRRRRKVRRSTGLAASSKDCHPHRCTQHCRCKNDYRHVQVRRRSLKDAHRSSERPPKRPNLTPSTMLLQMWCVNYSVMYLCLQGPERELRMRCPRRIKIVQLQGRGD